MTINKLLVLLLTCTISVACQSSPTAVHVGDEGKLWISGSMFGLENETQHNNLGFTVSKSREFADSDGTEQRYTYSSESEIVFSVDVSNGEIYRIRVYNKKITLEVKSVLLSVGENIDKLPDWEKCSMLTGDAKGKFVDCDLKSKVIIYVESKNGQYVIKEFLLNNYP